MRNLHGLNTRLVNVCLFLFFLIFSSVYHLLSHFHPLSRLKPLSMTESVLIMGSQRISHEFVAFHFHQSRRNSTEQDGVFGHLGQRYDPSRGKLNFLLSDKRAQSTKSRGRHSMTSYFMIVVLLFMPSFICWVGTNHLVLFLALRINHRALLAVDCNNKKLIVV